MPIAGRSTKTPSESRTVLVILCVATVYLVAARFGLLLALDYKNISPVWPPSGVALAAILVFGARVWPGILIGALLANVTTLPSAPVAIAIAIGNTLEALCGAYVLRHTGRFREDLARIQDVFRLLLAAAVGPIVAATIGVASLVAAGFVHAADYRAAWLTWWIGDAMGMVVLGAALLAWTARPAGSRFWPSWHPWRLAEAIGLAVAIIGVTAFVFGPGDDYPYAVFPALILAALGFGQRGASAAVLAVSGIAVWATLHGSGPFAKEDVAEGLLYLQTFLAVVSVTTLLLAAAVLERTHVARELELSEDRFRLALEHSDITVYNQDRELRYTWIYDGRNRFPPEIVLGRTDAELTNDADAKPLSEIKQRVLATGVGERAEVSAGPGGDSRTYDLVVEPVRGGAGSTVGVRGVATDITHIKEYQAAIESLNERLRRAMRETHHRVKNNLQVIAAMVDMRLMDGQELIPADEVRRLATHTRTLASVHDLLTNEARGDSDVQSLSAKQMIEKLVPMLQHVALDRPVTMSLDDVRLTPSQGSSLAIVVSELVGNAIKHGAGEVEISLAKQTDCAHLSVRDHGAGFPPDFDLRRSANTGLELVENLSRWDLGGGMECNNADGGGALVRVKFCPLVVGASAESTLFADRSPAAK